jgi:hypothetical protein
MWNIINYDKEATSRWMNYYNDRFLKYAHPFVTPTTPFHIEVTINVYNELKKIYIYNEERGGIIFCKILLEQNAWKLETVKVNEVENTCGAEPNELGKSRANCYRPNGEQYLGYMHENFSQNDLDSILFPIHFHTHPTKNEQEAFQYYNSYSHRKLNTSAQDRKVAEGRFLQFGTVKLRYMNAIITGHANNYNIMFYAKDVTPLNFMKTKFKRLQDAIEKCGDNISRPIESKTSSGFTKVVVNFLGAIAIGLGYKYRMIDYAANLFEDREYFGSLYSDKPTVFKIPLYIENGS